MLANSDAELRLHPRRLRGGSSLHSPEYSHWDCNVPAVGPSAHTYKVNRQRLGITHVGQIHRYLVLWTRNRLKEADFRLLPV